MASEFSYPGPLAGEASLMTVLIEIVTAWLRVQLAWWEVLHELTSDP